MIPDQVRNFVIEGVACQPPEETASHSSITNFLTGQDLSPDPQPIIIKVLLLVLDVEISERFVFS